MESGHKIGQNTILGECLGIKTVKITCFILEISEIVFVLSYIEAQDRENGLKHLNIFQTYKKVQVCSSIFHSLCKLDKYDPIGKGGAQERGDQASVHSEVPTS